MIFNLRALTCKTFKQTSRLFEKKENDMLQKFHFLGSILFIFSIILIYNSQSQAKKNSAGLLAPSIYFLPIYNLDRQSCSKNSYRSIVSEKGAIIARVCAPIFNSCLMEGTCLLTNNRKQMTTINYTATVKGARRFKVLPQEGCRWGIGSTGACLDPFHTVAADRKFHKIGEVIYVPKLRDLTLPNGLKHNGYLIVRDVGGAIKGPHRFDFFTGIYGALDSSNPFNKAGLADTHHRLEYRVVQGTLADQVRGVRNYPTIPASPLSPL